MSDLNRYIDIAEPAHVPASFVWQLPNGYRISVIPDPHEPLHFELLDVTHGNSSTPAPGLTTTQVQEKLAEFAALPNV